MRQFFWYLSIVVTYSIVAVFISACGSNVEQNSQLIPYLNQFKQYAAEQGVYVYTKELTLIIEEIDQADPSFCVLGTCRYGGAWGPAGPGDYRKITIDPMKWDIYLTPETRQVLLFHEFGHCILGREHDTTIAVHGNPKSIMYPFILSQYAYTTYFSSYISELFHW